MKNKRGISLIVLIITLVVIIILATAVIISLVNNNVIGNAKEAKFKNDVVSIKEAMNLEEANALINKADADYTDIIPDNYWKILEIKNGKLYYTAKNSEESEWAKKLGIEKGETIPEDWIDIAETTPKDGLSLLIGKLSSSEATVTFKVTTTEGNYKVDWGDGTSNTYASGVEATHTYGTNNDKLSKDGYLFQVNIKPDTGNITKYTTVTTSETKNTSILWCEVGCNTLTSCENMFNYVSNLRRFGTANKNTLNNVTNMVYMFSNCSNLPEIPEIDTSNVTDMHHMFNGCISLTTIPKLNTSSVIDMHYMFYNCSNLKTIPLLDTSNVTNMATTFYGCRKLTKIPKLDIGNVKFAAYMFSGCSSLASIPELNTSSVTQTHYMFRFCSSLETIPKLDTSSVTKMENMFQDCIKLKSLNIAGTNLTNTQIDNVFDVLPKFIPGTIDITGNPGASTCTRSKATDKGWTVIP